MPSPKDPIKRKQWIENLRKSHRSKPREIRVCAHSDCENLFKVIITSKKRYCSNCCGSKGKISSSYRKDKTWEEIYGVERTKEKRDNFKKKFPREIRICAYKNCKNTFECRIDYKKKYCSYGCYWKADYVCPNKLEIFLNELLQNLFPDEYKFVGNGEFILAGRCPDFVNINGQKKIIELFGHYWHGEEFRSQYQNDFLSNEQHEQQRINHFAKYGYQTLIIWEYELKNENMILNRIKEFSCGKA